MSNNSNLSVAKKIKNDEFYTQLSDIEEEVKYYKKYFENSIILCNCDNPGWSNFWKYFHLNFSKLKLKKLISTHYEVDKFSYKMEYEGGNDNDISVGIKTNLIQNGDFRSQECLDVLKEADIIVTNPPFSLFRDFIDILEKNNKKFLIIGSMNAITYKEVFPLIKNNKLWLGINSPKEFIQPDKTIKKFGNIIWYTNLDNEKRNKKLELLKEYNNDYLKYDDYDCIEVPKVKDIPKNYYGVMGVPISFLNKYNPDQFEILGLDDHRVEWKGKAPSINGKQLYRRIIIKRKK